MTSTTIAALPEGMRRRVSELDNGCWAWTGTLKETGYGRYRLPDKRFVHAHRAVWEAVVGPIPAGAELDHLCHNAESGCTGGWTCQHRRCVNPAHLEPVTPRENTIRARSLILACPRGHPYKAHVVNLRGGRVCRQCEQIARKALRQRKKKA